MCLYFICLLYFRTIYVRVYVCIMQRFILMSLPKRWKTMRSTASTAVANINTSAIYTIINICILVCDSTSISIVGCCISLLTGECVKINKRSSLPHWQSLYRRKSGRTNGILWKTKAWNFYGNTSGKANNARVYNNDTIAL